MGASFLIILREGFEAALVVAIVLAYLRSVRRPELRSTVWLGVAVAAAIALAAGLVLEVAVDGLEGEARMRTFAAISAGAAVVLAWMVFWMRKQSRTIKGDLESAVDRALNEGTAKRALFLVAFFAVLREGIETALFLVAAATGAGTGDILLGGALGLAAASALGLLVYHGGRRVPLRQFFRVTGFLIILFAAGLADKAVMFLQASGDVGSANDAVYDLTSQTWLTTGSEVGKFLAGIFGWDPRPSVEQVLAWALVALPLTVLFLRRPAPVGRPA